MSARRVFLASPLAIEDAWRLAAWARGVGGARLVPAGALHVTWAFVGGVTEQELGALAEATRACHWPGVVGRLLPLRRFGSRALALPLECDPEPLGTATEAVRRLLDHAGLAAEVAGAAHVTLARSKPGASLALLPETGPGGSLPLARLVLFESLLRPDGAKYVELAAART